MNPIVKKVNKKCNFFFLLFHESLMQLFFLSVRTFVQKYKKDTLHFGNNALILYHKGYDFFHLEKDYTTVLNC